MAEPLGTANGYCFTREPGQDPGKWALQNAARELLHDNKRLGACHRVMTRGAAGAEVYVSEDGGAWFGGLMVCSQVWVCPVCAAKISEHRREEMQQAIDNAITHKMGVTLVTLTFRHGLEMQLDDTLTRFAKALRRFKSGKAYKQLRGRFGLVGEVRALEVTHGKNGWHPHTHAVTFSQNPIKGHDLTRLKRALFLLWAKACDKEGLPNPSYAHGVDVRPAKYAAEYACKWGFASEMTRTHMKKGKPGGRNPWRLLADAAAGDKRAAWLFREFAACFKGKRQLFWSRGLRDLVGVGGEITDQEVMDLEPVEKTHVLTIDPDTWALVLRAGVRAYVLHLATQCKQELMGYLNRLRCTVPMWNGRQLQPREDWAT